METETTEGECVMVEIPCNQPVNNNNSVVIKEWLDCLKGMEITNNTCQRHIQKVPPLLLEGEKGGRNRKYYEPAVVSLGPYHYKSRAHLAQAEEYKLITLEEFCLSTKKTIRFLYNKVFEVVHEARKCYIYGSTDAYNDEEFNGMMLHDGCFILFFIESISIASTKLLLNNEYLGALGFANVARDIFLLENQIPFVVLELLLKLRFPDDKGENILSRFFNYLKDGEVLVTRDEKVLGNKQPLHLLELYRSYFISLPTSLGHNISHYDWLRRSRNFPSATELKSQWIFLRRAYNDYDIAFHSHRFCGVFEFPRRAISTSTKAIYLNMIAHELCAHNPNDFRVSTYIRIMKSLIIKDHDVKELKKKDILIHSLSSDEQVVNMYDEIEVPAINGHLFFQFLRVFENHLDNKYKTWVGELITDHFSSPWKTVALLAATAILFTTFLQTYFAAKQLHD